MPARPDHWRRLEGAFREAAEAPPEGRPAVLDAACAGDPELRRDVEALLEADAGSEAFLASALQAGLRLAGSLADPGEVPAAVGPYRLLHEIGRGGMSRVFLAERADGEFEKRVAVKLLRPDAGGAEISRRFHNERQILARLEHPDIARLHDGGTTDGGRPYFVMEVVDGEPIDRYCDRRGLDVPARLRLFARVCRAVHYAHQNLVVHRDLKPSNVLVTRAGEPKLLDFGIGKVLDPDLAAEATRASLRPMTPGYASPEQVRGKPVTTASDVYSLGVLLYLLLAGRLPFALEGTSAGELERRIAEEEPPPPSAAAVAGEARRRLAGDLDTIVAMAMAKEPARRYPSAEQLARDVERHLAGEPVIARRPTFGYRASRFLGRHRWPASAAAAFGLLLVAFTAITAAQAAHVAAERDRAERVAAVLVDLFRSADDGDGGTVTAREILDRGAERVRSEIAGPPELRATLLEALAGAYRNLGLYEQAEPLLVEALTVRRRRGGAELRLAETLDALGVVRALRGEYADAEPLLAEALAIRERVLEPSHPDVARSLNNLALVRHDRGDYAGAEPLYRRVLALEPDDGGAAGRGRLTTLSNLALLLHDLGRYAEAEAAYREVLERRRRLLGPDHPDLAAALGDLGRVVEARGRWQEAEPLLGRAVELARARYPEGHPELARAYHQLGDLLGRSRASAEEGEALLRRALAMREASLGADHPETAASRLALARLLAGRGDAEAAAGFYARAAASFRAALPAGHPSLGEALLGRGGFLVERGACPAAAPLLTEAREIFAAGIGPHDWRAAAAASFLGTCLARSGRRAEGARLLAESLRDMEAALGPAHPEVRAARRRLAALGR
jgi:serine/threonine-protein kinase